MWFELAEFELLPASADSMLLRLTGRWGATSTRRLKQPELVLNLDGARHVLELLTGDEPDPQATEQGSAWTAGYSAPRSLLARPRVSCTLELEGDTFALIPVGIPADTRSQVIQVVDTREALAIANQRAAAAEQEASAQLEARAQLERALGERESELSRLQIHVEAATQQRELESSTAARRQHEQELRDRSLTEALSVVDVEAARLQSQVIEQERRYVIAAGVLERLTARLGQVDGRAVDLDQAIAETERLAAPIEVERARASGLERDLLAERGHLEWLQAERDAERDQLQRQVRSLESELHRERTRREGADRELAQARQLAERGDDEARRLAAEHAEDLEIHRRLGDLVAGTEKRAATLVEQVAALQSAMSIIGERSLELECRSAEESERVGALTEGAVELGTKLDAQLRRETGLSRTLDDVRARVEARDVELSVARGRAEQLESELTETRSARSALDGELMQSEATRRQIDAELAQGRDELAATERRIELLATERDDAIAYRQEAERRVQGLRASVGAFNDRLSMFHLRVTNAEARAGTLDRRAAEAGASIEALQEMTDDLAEQLAARQAELARASAQTKLQERAAEQSAGRVQQLEASLDAIALERAEEVREAQARTEELARERDAA
ncbi:MAG: hypothetical protein DLM64_09750, partial [Solirubrobacterales bacterium]